MSLRRVFAHRLSALAAVTTLIAVSVAAPGSAAVAPAYTLEERALAIASPSLVFLEETYTGYIRDKATHTALIAPPITFGRRCSGFVVNADGYVATPSSCINTSDEGIRTGVLYEAAEVLIKEGRLDPAGRDAWVAGHVPTSEFTGLEPDSRADVKLFGQFNVATAGISGAPAVTGQVAATVAGTDITIIKLDQGNLPVVELQTSQSLAQGATLIIIGFATSDPDARQGSFTLASKPVQVTGQGTIGSLTFSKVNGDVGLTSNGGMAVDTSGRVVGMLNNDWTAPGTPVRAIIPSSAIVEALGQIPASNTLGATDKLYRSGLDAYFRGEYDTAITQLDTVGKDAPTNRTAATFRQQAEDRRAIEAGSAGVPVWAWAVGAAAIGALIAGLITALIIGGRRRRREATAEAELLVPVSLNPFAPTSSMPFSAPPSSSPPATYQGTALPHPAPPGVPVPLPPSVYPAAHTEPVPPLGPAVQPDVAETSDVVPAQAAPAPPEETADEPPSFEWPPEEDGNRRLDDYPQSPNPWAPGSR